MSKSISVKCVECGKLIPTAFLQLHGPKNQLVLLVECTCGTAALVNTDGTLAEPLRDDPKGSLFVEA